MGESQGLSNIRAVYSYIREYENPWFINKGLLDYGK